VRLGDETILTGYGSPTTYETAALSLAVAEAAGPRVVSLSEDTTVFFGLPDRFESGADNSGGLRREVVGPGLSIVPLALSPLFLIAGVGGLAMLRRRGAA